MLHELQKILGSDSFNETVYAFGSKDGFIQSTGFNTGRIQIPIYALSSLLELVGHKKNVLVIHAAFLTKDRIPEIGLDQYIKTNKWITEKVNSLMNKVSSCRLSLISTGAVTRIDNEDSDRAIKVNPYGALKLEEEKLLSDSGETQIFRIYALSGRFIRDPHKFALGDFLMRARAGMPIIVSSPSPVIRGYGHAGDIARSAISWLQSNAAKSGIISTVSDVLSLCELAGLISSIYSLPPAIVMQITGQNPDIYTCNPHEFRLFASRLGIELTTISNQIHDTSLGIEC
jgi:nucleoside-diphosphate-sugar epimerase